jgi:glycosyltransferase involved in cell wall biosynthesis
MSKDIQSDGECGGVASGPAEETTGSVLLTSRRHVRRQSLSIVLPAYNEESNVEQTYKRLRLVLEGIDLDWWELIFSVDPSTDRTEEVILALRDRDPRIKMLRFSRRFGQPSATIAGMEASTGDAVVVMDCDLQDPPELIADLVVQWRDGYDVVYAQRRTRAGETWAKKLWAGMAYRVINHIAEVEIPKNTGDFRLMSRRVVENVVALRETHIFLRGLVPLVGFRQTGVLYDREPRRRLFSLSVAGDLGRWDNVVCLRFLFRDRLLDSQACRLCISRWQSDDRYSRLIF